MANEKRLIDANALIEQFRVVAQSGGAVTYHVSDICAAIEDEAIEAPVDAVEAVHAHWEDGCAVHNGKEVYKSIDCSHCNEMFKTEDREYWKKRFKVCPFCGAVMDGGNEDV